jgi:alpha-glucosidase
MPWDHPDRWDREVYRWYRSLIRLRSSSAALAHGGFRWVHRSPDAIAFLRETADERLLVRATRAASPPLVLDRAALGAAGVELVGGAGTVTETTSAITFDGDTASFAVWRLHD